LLTAAATGAWRPAEQGQKGKKKAVYIWAVGTVEEVADGTIKKSARTKQGGVASADALRLEAKSLFNVASLFDRAEAARLDREARGVLDSV